MAMAKGTNAEGSFLTGQDLTLARESIVPCAVSSGKNEQWPKRPYCQLTRSSSLLSLSRSSWNRQISWGVLSCLGGRQARLNKLYVRGIKGFINQKASR